MLSIPHLLRPSSRPALPLSLSLWPLKCTGSSPLCPHIESLPHTACTHSPSTCLPRCWPPQLPKTASGLRLPLWAWCSLLQTLPLLSNANTAPPPKQMTPSPHEPTEHTCGAVACLLLQYSFSPRCPAHWPKATRFLFTHRSGEAASRVHSWGPTPRFTEAQLSRCSFPFSNPFWKNPKCSHRDLPDALSGQTLSGPSGCWAPPDPAPAHTPSPASTTRLSDVVAASRMHCFNLKQLK